jgi:hypothetical protein
MAGVRVAARNEKKELKTAAEKSVAGEDYGRVGR